MRLSVKAFAIACGALWGGGILFAGILNLIWPPYGEHFLLTMSSVYPGYHATRAVGDILVGTTYGAVDGAVCGLLLAWIYNFFVAGKG